MYLTRAINPVKNIERDVFNALYNVTFAVQATNYKNNIYKGGKILVSVVYIR